jgi:hypothetical protein
MPNDRYNAAEAEPRWQQVWDERGIFRTRNDDKRPKYYVLERSWNSDQTFSASPRIHVR